MMALLPATLALAIAAAPAGKVALVDLDTPMVGMASQVTQALKDAAAAQKLAVISPEELRTQLGIKKYLELVKCGPKPACVSQVIGDVPGIARVVAGSLTVDDKHYNLKLALIDLQSLNVVADVDRAILIASRRFQKDVKDLVGPLLRGEREARSTLVVKTNANDAQVTVNGEFIGVAPVTLTLKPGKHEVKIARAKYLPVTRLVDLEPNQTFTADIRMILKPGEKAEDGVPALVAANGQGADDGPGFRLRAPTIVSLAATLVAFGVGTVFGIQSSSGEKTLLAGYNKTTMIYSGKRTDAIAVHNNALIANVSFAVAGAALIVTAVLFVFDIRAGNTPVQLAPAVNPDGAGVFFGGHF